MAVFAVALGTKVYPSLVAVGAVGVGSINDLDNVYATHSLQVNFTSNPAVAVDLEGSLDGVNFTKLASWSTSGGQVSGQIISVSGIPVRYVRANLVTLTGGTSPKVSAFIGSY